jgi:carbon-monoxide dehydrogenase medium subunit
MGLARRSSPTAASGRSVLRQALREVAHPTIRNRGTTVGSLVHADPAAEMPAVLALLGGTVDVVGPRSEPRTIAAGELFTGYLESALAADEVAVSAWFPHPPSGSGTCWLEVSRRRGDYALVGVGAVVTLGSQGHVTSARLALASVGPTPVVLDVSEEALPSPYPETDWAAAVEQVDAAIDPESDIHASAAYRRRLARVLSSRALQQATVAAQRRSASGRPG